MTTRIQHGTTRYIVERHWCPDDADGEYQWEEIGWRALLTNARNLAESERRKYDTMRVRLATYHRAHGWEHADTFDELEWGTDEWSDPVENISEGARA